MTEAPSLTGEQLHLIELADIATRISAALRMEDILSITVERILSLTGMESVVIYHAQSATHPLRCLGQQILPESNLHPAQQLYTETSIAGKAFRTGLMIVTPDATQSAEYGQRMMAVGALSGITLPLIARGNSVGVLQILSDKVRSFNPTLLTLLHGISQQLAIGLDNAVLRAAEQKRRIRAEMLQQVSLVLIATPDPVEAFEIIFDLLNDVMPFHVATVSFVENTRYQIADRADEENSTLFTPIQMLPIAQEIVRTWGPLFIPDTAQNRLWDGTAAYYPDVGCYIGAPLFRRDQVFGVLHVMSQTPYDYTEDDLSVVQTLATQFADAIEKAQLFRRMSQRERIADDLILMGVALGATLDEAELLELICQQSAPIFGVQGAYLWLVEGNEIVGMAAIGVGAEAFYGSRRELSNETSVAARIIRERHPAYVNHARISNEVSPLFLQITQARSFLGVPILRGNHAVGALLLVDTKNDQRFDSNDLEQLRLFGVQAALAIENARLFAETRRRLDQLRLVNEVGRVATSILTLGPLMEGISRPLFDEFNYHAISLLLVENDTLNLYSMLVNRQKMNVPEARSSVTLDSAARTAFLEGNPSLRRNQPTLSMMVNGHTHAADGWYELAVPLILAEEVIGILNVERFGLIAAEELDVLEPLSAQIAVTISNVRLFEMVRAQMLDLDARILSATLQLRVEKEHTEAILQSVADAVIMTDLTGQMITANPVAEAILRDTATIYGTQKGSLLEQIIELVHHLINGDKDVQTVIFEHGTTALQAKAAKVKESNQDVGAVIVLRDITYLQEIDRLKTQFVSNVSHELRTPLSNIKLYLQLLQTGRPEKRAAYQAIMESEANRLERLISDLLDLSRLDQRGQRQHEAIDIDQLIEALIEANLPQAEAKQLQLSYSPPVEKLPVIDGDRDQLTQVLINLIGNALHYTPENGTITVSAQQFANHIQIDVHDNGIGINSDDLPYIFDRFYRGVNVKNGTVPGTGLGLAICKEIVLLHGGTLSVDSTPGAGSTFSFTLPYVLSQS